MDMQEALREYLAPVEANNALTIEHKKVIANYVRGFVDFIDAKQHAIDNPPEEPVLDTKDIHAPEEKQVSESV